MNKEWEKIFTNARASVSIKDISDEELMKIMSSCASVDQFSILFQYLFKTFKSNPNGHQIVVRFFKMVDDSSYSLPEWIETIEVFHNWLCSKGRQTEFSKLIGYLQCSDLAPDNKDTKHVFKDLVLEMLNTHGYVGK